MKKKNLFKKKKLKILLLKILILLSIEFFLENLKKFNNNQFNIFFLNGEFLLGESKYKYSLQAIWIVNRDFSMILQNTD